MTWAELNVRLRPDSGPLVTGTESSHRSIYSNLHQAQHLLSRWPGVRRDNRPTADFAELFEILTVLIDLAS